MNKKIGNILLLLISLCFSIFFIEILLRLFYPQISICKINYEWRSDDPVLPYVPKPNYHGRMILKNQLNVDFTTNSGGFRNLKDYAIEKPKNAKRIIFIGDSFVFGWGVKDDEVFTYLLENNFNKKSKNTKVEIINAAVYGYDIDEYRILFDRILKYEPDIIFLGYCLENDFNFTVRKEGVITEELRAERKSLVRFIRETINNLHIVALVRDRLYITFPKIRSLMISLGINNKRDIFLKKYPETLNRLLIENEKILSHMQGICSERGIKFVVLLIPLKEQVYCREALNKFSEFDAERPNQVLAEILKRNNIEYIDLLPELFEQSKISKDGLYFDTDPHWTRYGHKIVAGMLFNRYKRLLEK